MQIRQRMAAAGVTALLFASVACGSQGADFWDRQAQQESSLDARSTSEILQDDLADLDKLHDVRGSAAPEVQAPFVQVFAGYDGAAVSAYIAARLKYFFTSEDPPAISPGLSSLKHKGWLETAKDPDNRRDTALPGSDFAALAATDAGERARVGGQNLGVVLWMLSEVNHTRMGVRLDGRWTEVKSSRPGIMLIGEGYRAGSFRGNAYSEYGPLVRRHVLVHEARHSDCTGGLSRRNLRAAREARSHEDYLDRSNNPLCGHFHVPCKTGSYKGLLACDAHPWGAYGVGLVYLQAALAQLDPLSPEAVTATAMSLDIHDRLLFSPRAMLAGELGPPDMSHSDTVVP